MFLSSLWLDCSTKLDLRTQVIVHPVKQVDEFLLFNCRLLILYFILSISDKGSGNRRSRLQLFFYRICDPVRYISNVRDPDLKGFKILVNAVTLKRMETSDEREFQPTKKAVIEERISSELNIITTPWGIEISSVHM